jgi:hypothetical protein
MRKLFLYMTSTVDGFVAGPDGELDWMSPASASCRYHKTAVCVGANLSQHLPPVRWRHSGRQVGGSGQFRGHRHAKETLQATRHCIRGGGYEGGGWSASASS